MHESFGTSEPFVENAYPHPGAEVADEAYDGTQFDVGVVDDRVRSPDYLPDQIAEDADCVDMASTPEAIDVAHAEALLADMHAEAWELSTELWNYLDRQDDTFKENYSQVAARELERSDSTGFYDSLSARICAFVALAPLADEPKVEAVMERAAPLVTQGRQLEQEVIVAASQETAELRSKLFEEADWEKIVNMYCDQSTEVDTVEPALYPIGYRQLWTAFRQFNSDYKMPDDYRIVLANRDALQSVRQEAITYGHIQQSDQPWEMPEGWQPNPAVTTESYNLKTAQKYLAPLRRSFTDGNAEFDRLKSLARLGLAIGFSTEDISSPDGVPPRLAHLLESRMLDALRRFDEADEANIAEITATLPEAISVEDPDDLMQVLGVDDVDAWVAARLVDMPDHMKQGMGRVTFVPKYEAPVFTYGGNCQWRV